MTEQLASVGQEGLCKLTELTTNIKQSQKGCINGTSTDSVTPVKRPAEQLLHTETEPSKRVKTDANSFKNPCKAPGGQAAKSLSHLLQWKEEMQQPQRPFPIDSYKYLLSLFRNVQVERLTDCKLDEHGQNLQAVLINACWQPDEPNGLSLEEFNRLQLSDTLLSNGIVFVWAEKENMSPVMSHLESMGYVYVQIFSFILISTNKLQQYQPPKPVKKNMSILDFFQRKQPLKEQTKVSLPEEKKDFFKVKAEDMPEADPVDLLANHPYESFKKTKKNLLLMRKVTSQANQINKKEQLELRHQRTSDVYFVLYDEEKRRMDPKSSECIYRMIETLLIKANYQSSEPLKMMELWAEPGTSRPGWISVSETKK